MEPKPTAVLFVDICGSTAYTDRHGEVAGRTMANRCFAVVVPEVDKRDGRIVKYLGDGFLAVFPTAGDLVEAATGMQSGLSFDNETRAEAARIRIHLGGDFGPAVEAADGDVFGDVVNTAARVQNVAGPDQIYVTSDLVRELPSSLQEKVRPVGAFPLRGKEADVELYEVMWKFDGATVLVSRAALRSEIGARLVFAAASFELGAARTKIRIGRIAGNDLVVDDTAVSREHAEVLRRKDAIYLVDRSTNGTYLRPQGGRARHLHREEIPLEGSGEFSLGRPDGPPVSYKVS